MGAEHPLTAESLSSIGNVLVDQGKPKQAIGPLERALRICKKMTCQPEPYGQGLFALARVLATTGGNHQRVIRLAKQAREEFGKAAYLKKEQEAIDAWMKKIQ